MAQGFRSTDEPDEPGPPARRGVAARVAGVLLLLVGVANATLGGISLRTGLVRLTEARAWALVALGLLVVVLGALVLRGVRWATVLALVVVALLFVAQLFVAGDGAGPAPALVTLAAVGLPLAVAARDQSRDARA